MSWMDCGFRRLTQTPSAYSGGKHKLPVCQTSNREAHGIQNAAVAVSISTIRDCDALEHIEGVGPPARRTQKL